MKTYKCDWCGKDYETQPCWRKKSKHGFCSRACKYEWNTTLVGYWKGKKIPKEFRDRMSANHADVSGDKNPRWKGGRRIDKDGYVLIWLPDHPYHDYHGYVREHRLVMEKKLGRHLMPDEVCHHIDNNKLNNDISNLELTDCHKHMSIHSKERWRKRNK